MNYWIIESLKKKGIKGLNQSIKNVINWKKIDLKKINFQKKEYWKEKTDFLSLRRWRDIQIEARCILCRDLNRKRRRQSHQCQEQEEWSDSSLHFRHVFFYDFLIFIENQLEKSPSLLISFLPSLKPLNSFLTLRSNYNLFKRIKMIAEKKFSFESYIYLFIYYFFSVFKIQHQIFSN